MLLVVFFFFLSLFALVESDASSDHRGTLHGENFSYLLFDILLMSQLVSDVVVVAAAAAVVKNKKMI